MTRPRTQHGRDAAIRAANLLRDDVPVPHVGELWRMRAEPRPTFTIARVTAARVTTRCEACGHVDTVPLRVVAALCDRVPRKV